MPITIAMSVEMFGYGFGFVGVILPGAVSGWIQEQLGYRRFFVWVLVSAIPAIVLSRFIPIRGGARASADEGAAV